MKNLREIIDPSANVYYFSFYLQGLYEVLGKKNVKFSAKYFKGLRRKEGIYAFDSNVCFVLLDENNKIVKRIAVDYADDACNFNGSAMRWADLYFKVNINPSYNTILDGQEQLDYSKIIQIPPYMGIRVWNFVETYWLLFSNFIKCFFNRPVFFFDYLKNYSLQYFHRQPLSSYSCGKLGGDNNYVFFASNLWKGNERLNGIRKKFIEFCKNSASMNFEGGLVNRSGNSSLNISDYQNVMLNQRYTHKEYLKKMKDSVIAFNTPAVLNCHGWKLAEYFCMGKVILSIPFVNQIPQGIVDGKNICFVSEDNIEKRLNDLSKEKMVELQKNARKYWDEYASPKSCVTYILETSLI